MDYILFSAILVGLLQIIKVSTGLNAKYIPISALVLSLAILSLYCWLEKTPFTWQIIENGIIVALSACGLWSGAKATIGK